MYFIFKGLIMTYLVGQNTNIKPLTKKFFTFTPIPLEVKFTEAFWKSLFLDEATYGQYTGLTAHIICDLILL